MYIYIYIYTHNTCLKKAWGFRFEVLPRALPGTPKACRTTAFMCVRAMCSATLGVWANFP